MMITIILIILSKKKIVPNMDTAKKSYILHYKKIITRKNCFKKNHCKFDKKKKKTMRRHLSIILVFLHWNHDMRDD